MFVQLQSLEEVVMRLRRCVGQLGKRAGADDGHLRLHTEVVIGDPPDDVAVFEAVDGVAKVRATPEGLVMARPQPEFESDGDDIDRDRTSTGGKVPAEVASHQNGSGSEGRAVDELEVRVREGKGRGAWTGEGCQSQRVRWAAEASGTGKPSSSRHGGQKPLLAGVGSRPTASALLLAPTRPPNECAGRQADRIPSRCWPLRPSSLRVCLI